MKTVVDKLIEELETPKFQDKFGIEFTLTVYPSIKEKYKQQEINFLYSLLEYVSLHDVDFTTITEKHIAVKRFLQSDFNI